MILHTVTEITHYIKELFEASDFLQDVLVEGEISNFKQASSGHCYFTLKDASAEIRCVMWRTLAARLTRIPEQGDLVEVRGNVSVYERGGSYQLYVKRLSDVGEGDIWRRYLELKDKLEREGLFSVEHKRDLPAWPRRIGVVTSPTGAALRDIQNVMGARYPLVELVLSPTLVQGIAAPKNIIRAIHRLEREPGIDVIIVARGGGSLEDLWAFSDEGVARTIFDCPIPVITGVGHETDFTLSDFCADKRTPTPSAAAAAAVPDGQEILERLGTMAFGLDEAIQRVFDQRWEQLDRAELLLAGLTPTRQLAEFGRWLADSRQRLDSAVRAILVKKESLVATERVRLATLDPRRVLERGYALVRDVSSGTRVTRKSMIVSEQELDIRFIDGTIRTKVISTEANKGDKKGNIYGEQ